MGIMRNRKIINNPSMFYHGEAGRTKSVEYKTYMSMKGRCYIRSATGYARYGGRGITVCDRWLGKEGYANFLQDMGRRPGPKYSLDRINNNGNYSPENCRWANRKTQDYNKPNTINIHIRGNIYTMDEICSKYELPRELLESYVQRAHSKNIVATYTEAFYWACLKKGIKPLSD